jgi:hypothetical protein
MARGWESKAVEAQQEEAAHDTRRPRPMSAAEVAKHSERMTLQLARARAQADLQTACAAAHRAMLEQAIADLDQRIKSLT